MATSKDREIEKLRKELAAMKSKKSKVESGLNLSVTSGKNRLAVAGLAGIKGYVFTFKRATIMDILENAKRIVEFLDEHPEIEE